MTYIAKAPLGRFQKGDIVGGLTDQQIKELLAHDLIELAEPTNQTMAKTSKPNPTNNQNLSTEVTTSTNTDLGETK